MHISFPGLLRSSRLIVARYGAGAAHRSGALERWEAAGVWGGRYIVEGKSLRFRRDTPLLRGTAPVPCPFEGALGIARASGNGL